MNHCNAQRSPGTHSTRRETCERMARALGLWGCGVFMSASSHATDLFKSCDAIPIEKSFRALSDYFTSHPGDHFYCLALSRSAFVFTTNGNFQDCRAEKSSNSLTCSPPSESLWYPDLDLVASFSGSGKSFALFHSEQLKAGNFGESYAVFYLVPQHVDVHGYRIVSLEGSGAHDQSDASGQCATAPDLESGQEMEDVVRAGSPPFEILNDGRSDVTIRINQQKVRCSTGELVDITMVYRWSGDRFTKVMSR